MTFAVGHIGIDPLWRIVVIMKLFGDGLASKEAANMQFQRNAIFFCSGTKLDVAVETPANNDDDKDTAVSATSPKPSGNNPMTSFFIAL